MIAVKIQCNCGQKYAFDVEPVGTFPPSTVACPACGADGTASANQFISQSLTVPTIPPAQAPPTAAMRISAPASAPTAAPVAASSVRMAAPTPSSAPVVARVAAVAGPARTNGAPAARLPGQLDPEKAVNEARSKIMWGDDRNTVTAFLRGNGFSAAEAKNAVDELINERAKTVRAEGVAKTIRGGALMCAPVLAVIGFLTLPFMPIYVLGASMAIGCYGFYLLIKGIFMMIAPKAEGGDVADQ
jgi:hypothetical protein